MGLETGARGRHVRVRRRSSAYHLIECWDDEMAKTGTGAGGLISMVGAPSSISGFVLYLISFIIMWQIKNGLRSEGTKLLA